MTRRLLVLVALLAIATAAAAAWWPEFKVSEISVPVGETVSVDVSARWSGIWVVPWRDFEFYSTAPWIAEVRGRMTSSRPGQAHITGVKPGEAKVMVRGYTYNVKITVVCGPESPILNATPVITTVIGNPVTIRVVTPIANRTAFTWYHGRIGDTSAQIAASGPEVPYVALSRGSHYAWVIATTPCSTSTAEFRIDAYAPKQRAVRR